jgi:L-malate glycosyltransferase
LKIGIVTYEYWPDIGGLGKSARRIAKSLRQLGEIHVLAACRSLPKGTITESQEDDMTVHRIGVSDWGLGTLKLLEELVVRLDQSIRFDIFHGLFLPSAKACLTASAGRPVIASIRGTDAVYWLQDPERAVVIREVISGSILITSVAGDLLARLADVQHTPFRSVTIPNAIDETRYREKWDIENVQRGSVGTVANFRKKKNIPLLLRGFVGVDQRYRSKLVLCGGFDHDPDLKSQLLLEAEEMGVHGSLVFTGAVRPREVEGFVRKMHVFSVTSNDDGMPNALLEAAAMGVPLVCTDVGGMHDIIEDGVNGLLVPAGNEKALSHAIFRLLSDDELARKLSVGALQLARGLSTEWESRCWTGLYRQILSGEFLVEGVS